MKQLFKFSNIEYFQKVKKNPFLASILATITGVLGIHRFYIKRKFSGLLFLSLTVVTIITINPILLSVFTILIMYCFVEGIYYAFLSLKEYINMFINYFKNLFLDTNSIIKQKSVTVESKKGILTEENSIKLQSTSHSNQVEKNNLTDSKINISNEIIDITDNELAPIDFVETGQLFNKIDNVIDWIELLEIPYERKVMENKQVKEETLIFYEKLCSHIDNELKIKETALIEEVNKLKNENRYYNNILYTIYCIAEGHVTQFYSSKTYDNSFSYQVLEQNLGSDVKNFVYNRSLKLEKLISAPNSETIEQFHLAKNGLPFEWWDGTGEIREKRIFTSQELDILKITPYRGTKIWKLEKISLEILNVYFQIWRIIIKNFDCEYTWKITSRTNILKIINNQYSYNSRTSNFLGSLIKLAEDTVRRSLPRTSLTQELKMDQDIHRIRLFLPKEIYDQIDAATKEYENTTSSDKYEQFLLELEQTGVANEIIVIEKILLREQSNEWKSLLIDQQNSDDYMKLLNNILKKSKNTELRLVALSEIGKQMKLSKSQKKLSRILLHKQNWETFEIYLSENRDDKLDHINIEYVLKMQQPIRKTIILNKEQITHSQSVLYNTVAVLDRFIDEELITKAEDIGTESDLMSLDSESEDSKFSMEAISLLRNLISEKKISTRTIGKIAMENGQLLNTYLTNINKEFFSELNDQLIISDDDYVSIDEYYIDFVEELLTREY